MSKFENVIIEKKANIYFDGKVTSRTIIFNDGSKKTLGIMLPGEYEFSTDLKEIIDIISGELSVLLPGEKKWMSFKSGDSFSIKEKSKFKLKIKNITDYCCSFIY